MVDYVRLAAVSKRLIEANGRKLIMIRPNEVAGDINKPWNGPMDTAKQTTVTISGVFVPPNTVRQFGLTALGTGTEFEDLIAYSEQVAIVYPEDHDLKQFTFMRDSGIDWNIIGLQVLRPGDIQLLAFIGVRR